MNCLCLADNYINNIQFKNIYRFEDKLFTSIYQPPPLQLYTQYSLQTYFFAFWGLLFLQLLTILICDKILARSIPGSATLWERIIHSMEKSHFPYPYVNWHEENGNCNDHLRRKNAVQFDVLLTMLINLLFNMALLFPLVILCKKTWQK